MCTPASEERIDQSASVYSEDGVDLTLIRWFLALSPAERLAYAARHASAILEIRARQVTKRA